MKDDYMEVALTVRQLCRCVEALCDFLVDKRIVDKFEIDCVMENAVVKATEAFEKEVSEAKSEESAENDSLETEQSW